ncbi:Endonuclease/exonuclease/phosphatase [Suillus plorans]|uniref:Endonuclease/exonuclease/phosphatase n=1 Tax=Suillus plorans TaxID=116603 RepID=A0A9P7J3I3_9AGAM|nr:Endonuclease/exonuclease/phosphatase [Suillus plorans]KAG1800742.1 Endonuclease/exonuclease/phosphatase [Suillus plorans]
MLNDQAGTLKALPEAAMTAPEVHRCISNTKDPMLHSATPSIGPTTLTPTSPAPTNVSASSSSLPTSPSPSTPQILPPVMFEQQNKPMTQLCIWQQNLNNSLIAQHSLLNGPIARDWDIIALQEPHMNSMKNTISSPFFHAIYPSTCFSSPKSKSRTILFPSPDVVVIQFQGSFGRCMVFNIYNDCVHTKTQDVLASFLDCEAACLRPTADNHMIWLGDFNKHHLLWDEDHNTHLFTNHYLDAAQPLLDLLADYGMLVMLPKGLPTCHISHSGPTSNNVSTHITVTYLRIIRGNGHA